jgi:tetratricopeptide (TPR) repeat protein
MKQRRSHFGLGIIPLFCLFGLALFASDAWQSANLTNEGAEILQKGNPQAALAKLDAAIKADRGNPAAHFWRGHALFALHDYRGALQAMLHSLKLDPYQGGGHYRWVANVYEKLGDSANTQRYIALAENPPKKNSIKPVVEIHEEYHDEFLTVMNEYQKGVGNPPVKIDMRLNNAARQHAEYLAANHFSEPVSNAWHYQEPGRPGFVGKYAAEQAGAFGFQASDDYFVGNTNNGGFTDYAPYLTGTHLAKQLAASVFHRSLVVGAGFEAIGLYRVTRENKSLLVYFMSLKYRSQNLQAVHYPYENEIDVPTTMLPEIPDPFPGDRSVGFPITVQFFSTAQLVPKVGRAELKNSKGELVAIYTLSPHSPGDTGTVLKGLKMVCIAPKDPLAPGETYHATINIFSDDREIFAKSWRFTTVVKQ